MKFEAVCGSLTERPCDVLIVNLFQGVKEPAGGTGAVDKALGGLIKNEIEETEFEGKLGETLVVRPCGQIPAKKVVVVGLGKKEDLGAPQVTRAAAAAGRKARELRAKRVVSILHGGGSGSVSAFDSGQAIALGTVLGTYEYTKLKTEDVKENLIETFEVVELAAEKLDEVERGMRRAEIIAGSIALARDLINEPSNFVTPAYLANVAQDIAREHGLECQIRDRKQIEDEGMGLLAAVGRGSVNEPRFIELRYTAPQAKKTIAIVGKGLTFDAGGYSLKLGDGMYNMKSDMSGAAAVIAAIKAIAQLKPDVNVVALAPATENMIGPNAIHPGDVFKSLSGKTVEVANTDAEGRLILADAVYYATTLNVDEIIDLATLTGACITAVGTRYSGIMGTKQEMIDALIEAGKSYDERMWQLPLVEEYKDYMKSDTADLKNTGGKGAAPTMGGLFIGSFVGDTPWAHIDLSSAFIDGDTELARKGATGMGTGTLIEYIMGQ